MTTSKSLYRDILDTLIKEMVEKSASACCPEHGMEIWNEMMQKVAMVAWELGQPSSEILHHTDLDVTEETFGYMSATAVQACRDVGLVNLHLHRVLLNGEPFFETGEVVPTDDVKEQFDGLRPVLEQLGEDTIRQFAKATVKVLRAHNFKAAEKDQAGRVAGQNPGHPIAALFGELLSEIIAEEIDASVSEFSQQLAGMLTVESFVPWSAPRGGERHDLPSP
jgi:hypothetical protein